MKIGHVDWLLNRIEELEEREKIYKEIIQSYGKIADGFVDDIENLVKRNEHYKQALEFYADEENYKENLISKAEYDADGICISNDEYAPPIIYFDSGEKARKALKGE